MKNAISESRKRVALLVETSLGSGRSILRGIASFAHQRGGWQLFHAAGGLAEVIPDWMRDWDGDAVIARIQSEEIRNRLEALEIPVVDVLGVCDSLFPLVHVDDAAIAGLVADHFRERDFSHVSFYGIEGENWSYRRGAAFAAGNAGAQSFHKLETPRLKGEGAGDSFRRLQQWIDDLPKPNGIFVCSDQRGLELLEACRSCGVSVPEEVAVVSVDDDHALCEISDPPMTSVRGGHFRVGLEAARLVEDLLAGKPGPSGPILVPPTGIALRETSDIRAIEDPVVARGVRYLRQNLAAPLTNDSIARAAGISRTLFQSRFREATGQTIREYILERRIERAVKLIENTDIPLAEVAERCGFRHQEYLGQVVKKALGKTPGTLRKAAVM